jgi:transcriptional regulator with XRE-family HTH domain
MPKPVHRAISPYVAEAVAYLGSLIREGRIARKQTISELAERAGVSRGLLQRIEKGDAGCSIGAAFEVASLVGIRLFDLDRATMTLSNDMLAQKLTLLPRSARPKEKSVKDDF